MEAWLLKLNTKTVITLCVWVKAFTLGTRINIFLDTAGRRRAWLDWFRCLWDYEQWESVMTKTLFNDLFPWNKNMFCRKRRHARRHTEVKEKEMRSRCLEVPHKSWNIIICNLRLMTGSWEVMLRCDTKLSNRASFNFLCSFPPTTNQEWKFDI